MFPRLQDLIRFRDGTSGNKIFENYPRHNYVKLHDKKIKKLLTEIHPDNSINADGLYFFNVILLNLTKFLANTAAEIIQNNECKRLTAQIAEQTINKILSDELQKNAINEGFKALEKLNTGLNLTDILILNHRDVKTIISI